MQDPIFQLQYKFTRFNLSFFSLSLFKLSQKIAIIFEIETSYSLVFTAFGIVGKQSLVTKYSLHSWVFFLLSQVSTCPVWHERFFQYCPSSQIGHQSEAPIAYKLHGTCFKIVFEFMNLSMFTKINLFSSHRNQKQDNF